ncbi:hypothetical protein [Shewanella surugensis]|uniref:Uncharacterized protein n=1 Tax=Shewanella surugensis TaxID=212020 RepID=A0ABT0LFX9_9GAMM|nr:hypothetical protein [Shewanella surugensis]MCL1126375.1 hypothetical protein [Shewanella surugensis]
MTKALTLIDNLIAQIDSYLDSSNSVTNSATNSHTTQTDLNIQRRINECQGTIALTHYDSVSTDINENNLSLDDSSNISKKLGKIDKLYKKATIDYNIDIQETCLITSQQDMLKKMDLVDHDGGKTSKTKWVIKDGQLYVASHAPWRQPSNPSSDDKKKIHHPEFSINSFGTLKNDMAQSGVFCGGELKVDENGKVISFNIDCSYTKEDGNSDTYKQQAKENGYASLLHFNQLGLLPDNLDELSIG